MHGEIPSLQSCAAFCGACAIRCILRGKYDGKSGSWQYPTPVHILVEGVIKYGQPCGGFTDFLITVHFIQHRFKAALCLRKTDRLSNV